MALTESFIEWGRNPRLMTYQDSVTGAHKLRVVIDGAAASAITYDNSGSGLTATNVQDAIDEIVATAGTGNVAGPGASDDNGLPRWNGTLGDTLQDSAWTISDAGVLSPKTNDGGAFGSSTLGVSDAFFADGAVLKFNNAYTITHSTGVLTTNGAVVITSAAAAAFAVGRLGSTTPAFSVDAATGTSVTGLKVTAAAAAGRLALAVTSSGTDEGLSIDAKGAGTIRLGATSTGNIEFSRAPVPTANDGVALGVSGTAFADIFLATGAIIDFGAGNITLTHSASVLTLSGSATTRKFAISAGTTTTSLNVLDITGTWNSGGTTFGGIILVNITNTASAAGSLLLDLKLGGTTQTSVRKDGLITTIGGIKATGGTSIIAGEFIGASSTTVVSFKSSGYNALVYNTDANWVAGSADRFYQASSSNTGVQILNFQNTNSAGYSNIGFYDNNNILTFSMGCGNSASDRSGVAYMKSAGNLDFYVGASRTFQVTAGGGVAARSDSAINTSIQLFQAYRQTSGTLANIVAGFGGYIGMYLDAVTGSNLEVARLEFVYTSTGGGSENVDMVSYVKRGGTITEAGRFLHQGGLSVNSDVLLNTSAALASGAGVGLGTLTNAPTAGDPAKWVKIIDNGTTRWIPTWT